ncbi:hypothetical protein LTR99_004113 [Exophiala xenobiotica]|uniref:Uncharacterized protein n=1 Tax=Vermiconidia calcicola TaxID=1690605 RepID=A0AAV9QNS0_9PEZI|nr:hypothetical protein LTR72_007537 [Exophiala xenobiotica]KAK5545125.1 hypothetical protein LTR25_000132 [Vermiconidia calcicola]KAK5292823.1 hypothetical protein LTR14_005172 [Exophiala xenobiotica]KAK5305047.1 hypothetical protein LTR99_004113 [Exophiala xenobiotica]KAK5435582.1 hypothetical protein LTR34_003086 [Exophiala xenobiotica]
MPDADSSPLSISLESRLPQPVNANQARANLARESSKTHHGTTRESDSPAETPETSRPASAASKASSIEPRSLLARQTSKRAQPDANGNGTQPGVFTAASATSKPSTNLSRSHSTTTNNSRRIGVKTSTSTSATPASGVAIAHSSAATNTTDAASTKSHSRTQSSSIARPKPDRGGTTPGHHQISGLARPKAKPAVSGAASASASASRSATSSSTSATTPSFAKPDFNTFKQHFSPKKALAPAPASVPRRHPVVPKPETLHAPSLHQGLIPANGTSGDLSRLRDELLQLTLLHDKAASTLRNYEVSIDVQIRAGREDLGIRLTTLTALERTRQINVNAHALKAWLEGTSADEGNAASLSTSRKAESKHHRGELSKTHDGILILAHVTNELTEVVHEDGPLDGVMEEFDRWRLSATSTPKGLEGDGNEQRNEVHFLTPLDPSWAATLSSIESRVQACRDLLADLPTPLCDGELESCIRVLIKTLVRLAEQVLQESGICRVVEGLILQREQEWMSKALTKALCVADAETQHQRSVGSARDAERKGIWEILDDG